MARGISAQAMRRIGNTHFVEQDHISSLFDIRSPLYKRGIKLLDTLHMDSAFTDWEDSLDINNNEAQWTF